MLGVPAGTAGPREVAPAPAAAAARHNQHLGGIMWGVGVAGVLGGHVGPTAAPSTLTGRQVRRPRADPSDVHVQRVGVGDRECSSDDSPPATDAAAVAVVPAVVPRVTNGRDFHGGDVDAHKKGFTVRSAVVVVPVDAAPAGCRRRGADNAPDDACE